MQSLNIHASTWFNTREPLDLNSLQGKVIVLHAFQMLCPGCVAHSIPQLLRIYRYYHPDDVQIIGLHSVFEHHHVMTIEALKVFIHEYRLPFPIAVDQPSEDGVIPQTMKQYALQGTPSLLLFDRTRKLRLRHFGAIDDLQLGDWLGKLSYEKSDSQDTPSPVHDDGSAEKCRI